MDKVSISQVQKPCSASQARSYSQIRLEALATDPAAFGSTYAREATFPVSTWIERLSGKGNITFYAIPKDATNSPAAQEPWIGILTLLSPAFLTSVPPSGHPPYPPEITSAQAQGADIWMLVGMWVKPQWRGKGVGKMLVDGAIKKVQRPSNEAMPLKSTDPAEEGSIAALIDVWTQSSEDAADKAVVPDCSDSNDDERTKDGIILLLVHDDNNAAIRLYSSIGFRDFPKSTPELNEAIQSALGGKHGGGAEPAPTSMLSKDAKWMGYMVERRL